VTNEEVRTINLDPFSVAIDADVLSDLRTRIRSTRWPDYVPDLDWEQGTDLDYLKGMLEYWADDFDWRDRERELNKFEHFLAEIDGVNIHFVHARATTPGAVPLILTHGWPSTFVELLPLVPLLTDPEAHCIDGVAFDLVIPSLPGYGFSQRPPRAGVTSRYTAGLWHRLMRGLGYERYGAQGGDFGAAVTTFMALQDPDPMLGIHLSNLELQPYTGPGSRPLSRAEREYLRRSEMWWEREGGYKAIQSTKPQTLGYGLNDSPAGLAAWILEKWQSWADCGGDPERRFSRELLLTNLTIYWVTQTITSSMRDYFDNRWFGGVTLDSTDFVEVPTALAVFADPAGPPPREWAERLYNVCSWSPMRSGGHFAATEEPELLAQDIASFFTRL